MKYTLVFGHHGNEPVASFAEAWIEIDKYKGQYLEITVASFAEAWIEMREIPWTVFGIPVASFAEAWIEIDLICYNC